MKRLGQKIYIPTRKTGIEVGIMKKIARSNRDGDSQTPISSKQVI